MKWNATGLAALLFFMAATLPAHGSSLVPMDLDSLAAGADRIFVGTVERMDARCASPTCRWIVTDVTVVSERDVLGVPEGTRFVVRRLGGSVGGVGQLVFGEASYRVGERIMLFAVERQGAYWALGMAQGVLRIARDEQGVLRAETQATDAVHRVEGVTPAATQAPPLEDVIARALSFSRRQSRAAACRTSKYD